MRHYQLRFKLELTEDMWTKNGLELTLYTNKAGKPQESEKFESVEILASHIQTLVKSELRHMLHEAQKGADACSHQVDVLQDALGVTREGVR